MKALKKGKEYTRVGPLPDGWLGEKEIARRAELKNIYQQSFIELKSLLDDGWKFCPKEPMRKSERERIAACEPKGRKGHKGKTGVKAKKKTRR